MCGIFGVLVKENSNLKSEFISDILKNIAEIAVSRGRDSSGIVFKNNHHQEFKLIKGDIPIHELLKSNQFNSFLKESLDYYNSGQPFQAIGHARLVTNGSQLKEENNQPVSKDGIIAIHNGIITNTDQLWKENTELKKQYDIDTEILLSIIKKELLVNTLPLAISNTINKIEGTASCALLFDDRNEIALFTNNGSLYYSLDNELLIFASEEYFIKQIIKTHTLKANVKHLKPLEGIIVNVNSFQTKAFNAKEQFKEHYKPTLHTNYKINSVNLKGNFDTEVVIDPREFTFKNKESHLLNLIENNSSAVNKLKRCTKCILPETFPFIEFDEKGICNYCKNYKSKFKSHSIEKLKELVAPYRRKDGNPDCIIPFSGGRDSTYSLHIIKKELKMNPITYTYDWGMVTDLARRNIARVCGKLGIENIIVAADIHQKRKFIKMNVEAWLHKPSLGMIPLFMSGDKAFHYYLVKLQKQTGISLNIWGENYLEKTDFKVGFAGIPPEFEKLKIYLMSRTNTFKMLLFLAKSVAQNPRYLNASLWDNLKGQYSRSFLKKTDYYNFYDYFPYNEEKINQTIINEYNWEKAIDTDSTWRIGDGTSAFYNYIYYTVAGFSEFDTFRSNQIREGMITREDALRSIENDNLARYETLRWYLQILDIDFETAIRKINSIPKLYPL